MPLPKRLEFSYNWNGKLSCGSFTTLRLYNPGKYVVGEHYDIYLGAKGKEKEFLGTAKLIGCRRTLLDQLNEFVARLDTGYQLSQCKKIIRSMYGGDKNHDLGLYLFIWSQPNKTASTNVKHLRHQVDLLSARLVDANRKLEESPLFTQQAESDE